MTLLLTSDSVGTVGEHRDHSWYWALRGDDVCLWSVVLPMEDPVEGNRSTVVHAKNERRYSHCYRMNASSHGHAIVSERNFQYRRNDWERSRVVRCVHRAQIEPFLTDQCMAMARSNASYDESAVSCSSNSRWSTTRDPQKPGVWPRSETSVSPSRQCSSNHRRFPRFRLSYRLTLWRIGAAVEMKALVLTVMTCAECH